MASFQLSDTLFVVALPVGSVRIRVCLWLVGWLRLSRYGEERYETKDFQTRVRQRFADLQALDTETPWHVVNAAQTMDQVEADIWEIVQQVLQTVADEQRPIGKLWTSTTANTSTTAAATTTTTTTTTTNAVKPTTTQAEESRWEHFR